MLKKDLRNAFGKRIVKLAKKLPIVVVDADVASSTKTDKFAEKFPEKFFQVGIAEQNMINVAAGLACCGKIVVAATFAVFASLRDIDQLRNSICVPNLNVKLVGTHTGFSLAVDGLSTQCTEDLGVISTLPNMKVVRPADSIETVGVVDVMCKKQGPFYLSLPKGDFPFIMPEDYKFSLGKGFVLREGKDLTLIGCGPVLGNVLEAAEKLSKEIDCSVINMASIKPVDKRLILDFVKKTNTIVTVEEHNVFNGLGSRVAEVLAESGKGRLIRIGVNDEFGDTAKTHKELINKYGLSTEKILERIRKVV